MIALPGGITNLHDDPELKELWEVFTKLCRSKSATLGQVTYAQGRFERAYKRKRNCMAARLEARL